MGRDPAGADGGDAGSAGGGGGGRGAGGDAGRADRGGSPGADGRCRIASGSPFESSIGFSRAVRVGDRVLVSGTAPIWPDGSCDPDPGVQARRCFEIAVSALREAGAGPEHVVATRMYITRPEHAGAVGRAHAERFAGVRPAATMVVVAGLLDPRWCVEVEVEAIVAPD